MSVKSLGRSYYNPPSPTFTEAKANLTDFRKKMMEDVEEEARKYLKESKILEVEDNSICFLGSWKFFSNSERTESYVLIKPTYLKGNYRLFCRCYIQMCIKDKVGTAMTKAVNNNINDDFRPDYSQYFYRRLYGKLINTFSGKSSKDLVALVSGLIWNRLLDKDIARFTIKIAGHNAFASDYGYIARRWSEIPEVLEKSPGILPLWLSAQQHFNGLNKSSFLDEIAEMFSIMEVPLESLDIIKDLTLNEGKLVSLLFKESSLPSIYHGISKPDGLRNPARYYSRNIFVNSLNLLLALKGYKPRPTVLKKILRLGNFNPELNPFKCALVQHHNTKLVRDQLLEIERLYEEYKCLWSNYTISYHEVVFKLMDMERFMLQFFPEEEISRFNSLLLEAREKRKGTGEDFF